MTPVDLLTRVPRTDRGRIDTIRGLASGALSGLISSKAFIYNSLIAVMPRSFDVGSGLAIEMLG